MRFVCPLLVVEDMAVARKFYEEVLGQQVRYDFGENLEFAGGFSLHLGEHFRRLLGVTAPVVPDAAPRFELYFEAEDLPPIAARLKELGVRFVHPLREQPWAQRVMRVYDPDGHVVEIGESMDAVVRRLAGQGMSPAAIGARTSLPPEFVERALAGE